MSWMNKNYEKVLLGAGAVAAIGLAFVGWNAAGGVEEELQKPATGAGNNNTAVPGAEAVDGAASSLAAKPAWKPFEDEEEGRPLDLFVGPPLFAKRGAKEPVDLWKDEPVHPPVKNRWWLEHRVDPSFADSPQRDPDEDGYSNLEEFEGQTDPSDARSHPELIAKLTYVKDESYRHLILFSGDFGANQFQFKFYDDANKEGLRHKNPVAAGGNIFDEGPVAGRFKLIEVQERNVRNERLNIDQLQKFAVIEDLKPNKKGDRFEIPRTIPRANIPQLQRFDRKAVLDLRAAGFSGKEFKVEERTAFALPPDAPEKKFTLKEVTPDSVTVEWQDEKGQARSVHIPKGGTPKP